MLSSVAARGYRLRTRSPAEARDCLAVFRERYNELRPHWALVPETGGDPVTPSEVYRGSMAIQLPEWQGWAKAAQKKLDAMMAGPERGEEAA